MHWANFLKRERDTWVFSKLWGKRKSWWGHVGLNLEKEACRLRPQIILVRSAQPLILLLRMVNLKKKALLGFFKQVLKRQIITCHIFCVSWQELILWAQLPLQSLLFKDLFHFHNFHQFYVTGEKIHTPLHNYSIFPVPNFGLSASASPLSR